MRYKTEQGIIDTDQVQRSWAEDTVWDGSNHISKNTGSQWEHEELFQSNKGQFFIEHTSQWQGSTASVTLVTPEAATQWLLLNDREVPEDLKQHEEGILV